MMLHHKAGAASSLLQCTPTNPSGGCKLPGGTYDVLCVILVREALAAYQG